MNAQAVKESFHHQRALASLERVGWRDRHEIPSLPNLVPKLRNRTKIDDAAPPPSLARFRANLHDCVYLICRCQNRGRWRVAGRGMFQQAGVMSARNDRFGSCPARRERTFRRSAKVRGYDSRYGRSFRPRARRKLLETNSDRQIIDRMTRAKGLPTGRNL